MIGKDPLIDGEIGKDMVNAGLCKRGRGLLKGRSRIPFGNDSCCSITWCIDILGQPGVRHQLLNLRMILILILQLLWALAPIYSATLGFLNPKRRILGLSLGDCTCLRLLLVASGSCLHHLENLRSVSAGFLLLLVDDIRIAIAINNVINNVINLSLRPASTSEMTARISSIRLL